MLYYVERLVNGISDIKRTLAYKCSNPAENSEDANQQIDAVAKSSTRKLVLILYSKYS